MTPRTIVPLLGNLLKTHRKLLFLSGPRQAGKTTLAKRYCEEQGGGVYFNWDIITDQRRFVHNPYFFEDENCTPQNLVVLDEIHKYDGWKNYLKGVYDKYRQDFLFIVTGSGRLDLFKKGSDSLMGRYILLPLFPFTLSEMRGCFVTYDEFLGLLESGAPEGAAPEEYRTLYEMSGFPDPLFHAEKSYYNIWQQEHRTLLVREDIRDATRVREISKLELLSHLLVDRVGSSLSVNSLSEVLGVAFDTARSWIEIFKHFYYLFELHPFTGSLTRTLRKETKAYLFDWVEIEDAGFRFENMIALHLLKAVKTWKSLGAGNLELRYIRDKSKREVDFVIVNNNKPVLLVEAKAKDQSLSPDLVYFQEKLGVPVAIQVVHQSGVEKKMKKNERTQWIVSADKWLTCLP